MWVFTCCTFCAPCREKSQCLGPTSKTSFGPLGTVTARGECASETLRIISPSRHNMSTSRSCTSVRTRGSWHAQGDRHRAGCVDGEQAAGSEQHCVCGACSEGGGGAASDPVSVQVRPWRVRLSCWGVLLSRQAARGIPGWGTYLVCGFDPWSGCDSWSQVRECAGGSQVMFFPFLPWLPVSSERNFKNALGRGKELSVIKQTQREVLRSLSYPSPVSLTGAPRSSF